MKGVLELAKSFRAALAVTPRRSLCTSLAYTSFPNACCDDASLLLAAYLSDNGLQGSTRVHGVHGGHSGELRSHVWLQYNNTIIDITADQFSGYGIAPVLVTNQSSFHDSFELESRSIADFRLKFADDKEWLSKFSNDYETIFANIMVAAIR